jgi:hypothetical protein
MKSIVIVFKCVVCILLLIGSAFVDLIKSGFDYLLIGGSPKRGRHEVE